MESMEVDEVTVTKQTSNLLSMFHPGHQKQFETLLSQNVGLFNRKFKIKKSQRCGQDFLLTNRERNFYDLITLLIPVCDDELLEWQIILNEFNVKSRPDMKFFNDNFSHFVLKQLLNSSFFKYDFHDDHMLTKLIEEFRQMYFQFLISTLNQNSRCYEEISTALKEFPHCNYEIHFSDGLIRFSIQLDLDLAYVQLNITEDDYCSNISFDLPYPTDVASGYHSSVSISNKLEESLEISQIKYPKFTREKSLVKHIQVITTKIQDQINFLSLVESQRKKFIFQSLTKSGVNVIQWDAVHFKHITFLYNVEDFYFLVKINLEASGFKMTLKSVYNGAEHSTKFDFEKSFSELLFTVKENIYHFSIPFIKNVYERIVEI